jgi:hypothetical protein
VPRVGRQRCVLFPWDGPGRLRDRLTDELAASRDEWLTAIVFDQLVTDALDAKDPIVRFDLRHETQFQNVGPESGHLTASSVNQHSARLDSEAAAPLMSVEIVDGYYRKCANKELPSQVNARTTRIGESI